MKTCLACSMPLLNKEDFALGDMKSDFCIHCVDESGKVKSCDEIFNGGVMFFTEMLGVDKDKAERLTRKNMSSLPYWKTRDYEILKGEKASDEEFNEFLQKI